MPFSKSGKASSKPPGSTDPSRRAKQRLQEEAPASQARLLGLITDLREPLGRSGLLACVKEAARLSSGVLEKAYLAKLAARLVGAPLEAGELFGVAAELAMLSALMVDDWIDHALVRAGRPALHVKYGPALTFLAATGLVEVAHIAVRCGCQGIPVSTRERIEDAFSQAVLSIQAGQALIERSDKPTASPATVDRLARLRCGHLIGFAMGVAGWLAESPESAAALEEAGIWIGTALQHRNDIQDFTIAFAQSIKPPMADLLNGQPNLVLSYIFRRAKQLPLSDRQFLMDLHGRNKSDTPKPLRKEEFDFVLHVVSRTDAGTLAVQQLVRCINKASGIFTENFDRGMLGEWNDYARLLHQP